MTRETPRRSLAQGPSRRALIAGGTAAALGLALPQTARATGAAGANDLRAWLDRHAVPLPRLDAGGPLDDLRILRPLIGDARIAGIGEPVHGAHTVTTLKHRVARFLVERLGFRTIAWEESWAAGVAIDRYVTTGSGDAATVVGDALFMLRSHGILELVTWMREFNEGRPPHDRVRFLGADILELRPVLYDEIRAYVKDVAPHRYTELDGHLTEIAMRGGPQQHLVWYNDPDFTDELKRPYIEHARAVLDLVRRVGPGRSPVSWDDAVQHAQALVGWYESYTTAGDRQDTRERYIARFIETWRRRTGHRIAYSAANAHTAGVEEQVISFPDEYPGPDVTRRRMAGGILRRVHGRRYRSIATVFDHGDVLTGWERGGPSVYTMPSPHESFIDRDLGTARLPDYLVDLRHGAPPPVRRRLDGPAKLRTVSAHYVPEKDAEYYHTVDSLSGAFDAILHIDRITPTRLLNAPPS
ncbi:erythromycin esterase family protein [Actinomadura sp. KC06]|uniref:erythromycin esterase family protein n=1 Tax=Actinomadura sp. KC06 TaxID=2530369 RepID=UPI00104824DE|nr:erythromycin esterase family protein [Actinomadura sp. KC06]TDD25858.1 erythromycin esterase family protein [Actinomadura sp. KC06]